MPLKKTLTYLEDNFKQAGDAANHLYISYGRDKAFINNKEYTEEPIPINFTD